MYILRGVAKVKKRGGDGLSDDRGRREMLM